MNSTEIAIKWYSFQKVWVIIIQKNLQKHVIIHWFSENKCEWSFFAWKKLRIQDDHIAHKKMEEEHYHSFQTSTFAIFIHFLVSQQKWPNEERISSSIKNSWLFECSQNFPKLALADTNGKNNNSYRSILWFQLQNSFLKKWFFFAFFQKLWAGFWHGSKSSKVILTVGVQFRSPKYL